METSQTNMNSPGAGAAGRIDSIDAFRGLTILAMILVNDLGHVREIPRWLKHVPETADAMTFPDIVFPAFLFIVGMSIPLALRRRIARGDDRVELLWHVLGRTCALLVIGVLMVNIRGLDVEATGLTSPQWSVLMYLGVILVWNAYPKPRGAPSGTDAGGSRAMRGLAWLAFAPLRPAGVVLLIWLAVIYRGADGGHVTWLRTQWWGILGLIGWAYLVGSLGYLAFREQPAGLVGLWAFMMALCIADKNGALGRFTVARAINEYVSLGGHIGGHSAIVLAGMLAAMLPQAGGVSIAASQRIRRLIAMAVLLFVAGAMLRAPYGLSKIRITPAWCLCCPAICCVSYAALYWLLDVRGHRRGTALVKIAGGNALLAYILPSIVHGVLRMFGIDLLDDYLAVGMAGIGRSVTFTVLMLLATVGLTRLHIRLRL